MRKLYLTEFIAQSNEYKGVSHRLFIDALNEGGYWQYRGVSNNIYVSLVDGILQPVGPVEMKEYILKEVKSYKRFKDKKEEVLELIHKNASKLFGQQHLEMLPVLEPNLLKDTKDTSYICFKNGIVKITANSITTESYSSCKSQIWKSQIINRDFHLLDPSGEDKPCDFEKFLQNVCNNDVGRLNSLKSIIGYLLHGYKHPGRPHAVILLDERIPSQEHMPNGRTGKGLIVQSISKLRKAITEDGKRFNVKRTFSLQSVTLDTKLLVFDDVGVDFNIEEMFSMISEGVSIEKKYMSEDKIPYEDSPKIIFTSNYILSGQGSSHEARRIEFELSSHYNEKHKPEDDFGHLFFDDWDKDQWNQFDNLMLSCVQLYLKKGIIKPEVINKDFRLLTQETSLHFASFVKDNIKIGERYDKTELLEKFTGYLDDKGEVISITPNSFTKYLKKYAEVYKLNFDSKRSNGKTTVQFQSS